MPIIDNWSMWTLRLFATARSIITLWSYFARHVSYFPFAFCQCCTVWTFWTLYCWLNNFLIWVLCSGDNKNSSKENNVRDHQTNSFQQSSLPQEKSYFELGLGQPMVNNLICTWTVYVPELTDISFSLSSKLISFK